jgi:hypothetical protein
MLARLHLQVQRSPTNFEFYLKVSHCTPHNARRLGLHCLDLVCESIAHP